MDNNNIKQIGKYEVTNKVLGTGSFGKVFLGYVKDNPSNIVAVKVIPVISENTKFINKIKQEFEILSSISSENIVTLYKTARTKNNFYLFLEYCNDGDLRQILKQKKILSQRESLTFLKQIVNGFKEIYQKNIIHRDIKPANILIHNGVAKISDFGFARVVDEMEDMAAMTFIGTPIYMSPQILNAEPFSSKCDVWSLGFMFYQMLYGVYPWKGNSRHHLYENILKTPLQFPEKPFRTLKVKDLLRQMLQVNEENRISWYELFEHPLLKNDCESLKQKVIKINDIQDEMEKQANLNNLYIKNCIIAEKQNIENFSMIFGIKMDDQQNNLNQSLNDSQISNDDNLQDRRISAEQAVLKIQQILGYQRSLGIFLNYTANLIYRLYQQDIIELDVGQYFKTIFILQKRIIVIFQNILNIMANKNKLNDSISTSEWQFYLKSKDYFQFLLTIKTDQNQIKPYFKEVFKRVSLEFQNSPDQEFDQHLNDNFKLNFEEELKLQQLSKSILKQTKFILTEQRQGKEATIFFQTVLFLSFCIDEQKNLSLSTDFSKLYEDYEEMTVEQYKEILGFE